MRALELTAFHVRIRLRRPFRHASRIRTETDNLIVRCVLGDGTIGYGEGLPREYVTGDTIDSALALLKRSDLRSQLVGCVGFGQAVALAENLTLAEIPGDDRHCMGNAARCAVELSLLDAYCRWFDQPLSEVTRVAARDLFESKDWVRYSGAIGSARGLKLRAVAWLMRLYRFKQLKVKVGIDGQDDVKRLRIVRRITGKKMDLRVDANEAWTPANAKDKILALKPAGITAVEQPLPHENADELTTIRRDVDVPIMLDESLCSMTDAIRAKENGLTDLFNIRLSKCGGFIPSLRLAQFAAQNGIGYQLGCLVGETAILSAAGRHFASSVRGIRYLEGSYDRHLVRDALARKDITFRWGGWAPALRKPGLGIDIDPQSLKRVTVREERIVG